MAGRSRLNSAPSAGAAALKFPGSKGAPGSLAFPARALPACAVTSSLLGMSVLLFDGSRRKEQAQRRKRDTPCRPDGSTHVGHPSSNVPALSVESQDCQQAHRQAQADGRVAKNAPGDAVSEADANKQAQDAFRDQRQRPTQPDGNQGLMLHGD